MNGNDYWKGRKKEHEWGVVAQIHEPKYREFHHCSLCDRFVESGVERLFGVVEFNQIAKDNKVYEADSNVRLLSWKPYITKED